MSTYSVFLLSKHLFLSEKRFTPPSPPPRVKYSCRYPVILLFHLIPDSSNRTVRTCPLICNLHHGDHQSSSPPPSMSLCLPLPVAVVRPPTATHHPLSDYLSAGLLIASSLLLVADCHAIILSSCSSLQSPGHSFGFKLHLADL